MDIEEVDRMCSDFAERLMEHCESVRIFVTGRGSGSGTRSYTTGKGNCHAQRGQIAQWMRQDDEADREEARMICHCDDDDFDDGPGTTA